MVESSHAVEEGVAVYQNQRLEEGVEGSLVGSLKGRQLVGLVVEEGGCPPLVDGGGSWLAGVALRNSWQPEEAVEEGGMGLEVVGEEPQMVVGVEHFQSPVLIVAWERARLPGSVI